MLLKDLAGTIIFVRAILLTYMNDEQKLALVLECLDMDNPRSARDYIDNLLTWSPEDLTAYRKRRKREQAAMAGSSFRPHP